MTYCYSPMDCPSIFAGSGDCETVGHDIAVKGGGLAEAVNSALSSVLIQLNTDRYNNGERGFWGDQFLGFPIGNQLWRIAGSQAAFGVTATVDEYIREALGPLITQDLFDDIRVRVVRIAGGVEADVDLLRNGESIFRTVFNG